MIFLILHLVRVLLLVGLFQPENCLQGWFEYTRCQIALAC